MKEKVLLDRFESGYYRSKNDNAMVYEQIISLYKPYLTVDHLKQLSHPFTTQHNESMNQSVSAFAPKGKTFSRIQSLETRVAIAVVIQIKGYEAFWDIIFTECNMKLDDNLRAYLRRMDKQKRRKRQLAESKTSKLKRSKVRHQKLKNDHKQDMEAQKRGEVYEAGVALKSAKNDAKTLNTHALRNSVGTPKAKWRYKYWHQDYCQVLGHTTSASKLCGMHKQPKWKQEEAINKTMGDLIEKALQTTDNTSKYILIKNEPIVSNDT